MKNFHEKGIKLIQEDKRGQWDCFIGFIWQTTCETKTDALNWLNN